MAPAPKRRPRPPAAILLIVPSLVFMTALFAWPMVVGVGQALRGPDGPSTVYLSRMLEDPYFWPAVRYTAMLIALLIPVQFAVALVMALLLRERPRFAGLHFFIWVIPLAVSDLAAGLIWLSVFTDHGYLNTVLHHLGVESYDWLSYQNPTSMFVAVFMAELWRATSLVFVIVVAGLQNIPKDYDEAASVFGATYWQRLRHVILPQLRPSLQVAVLLRTILALQTFAVAQALTGRNFPLLVGEAYQWYYTLQNPNVAAAVALVVLAVSMLASAGYLRLLRERPGVNG
jgi:multiple sugar transport system permease protein